MLKNGITTVVDFFYLNGRGNEYALANYQGGRGSGHPPRPRAHVHGLGQGTSDYPRDGRGLKSLGRSEADTALGLRSQKLEIKLRKPMRSRANAQ
jgi:hypothetical protein